MGAPISAFVLHRRVQFPETDASGIVHFTNFFKYVEEAEHAMWRAVGLSISPRDAAVKWPRVSASLEFRRPLHFEDEFDVHLKVAELRARSIRYAVVLRKEDEVIAEGTLTIACAVREGGRLRSADIPPDIAARFAVAG